MNNKFNISPNGSWSGQVESKHQHDTKLANAILEILKNQNIKTLLDLGCGIGKYSKYFTENDISCDCFDGNPDTKILTNKLCDCLDLSVPIDLHKTYDCVLSLEVGEHIPESLENIFISNITKHSDRLIIMSWAIPGQIGDGHINCKSNQYIINKMISHKFNFSHNISNYLKENSSLWWFKNTLMVFTR
jgi:2-polyprenyl-3-methyl-5-hydroxy-6-metoxy-1,4-benzoquinol methylase